MRDKKDIQTEKKVSEVEEDFELITDAIIRDDIEGFEKAISKKILKREED